MPKSKSQFAEIRQRSIATIKETALELFAERGYHNTSISDIAKKAAISKGLMYNYFDSKDALLFSILGDAIHVGEQMFQEALASSEDAFEQLKYLTENTITWIKANLGYWKLLISLAFQPEAMKMLAPTLREKEVETMGKAIEIFQRLGVERPEAEAMFYGAIMDGIVIQYVQIGEGYPLDMMKDMILERYKKKSESEFTAF
ncbi:MAG: TetR/AcrR family transcriptional regulator [Saprospiraceae bacterium]